MILKLTTPYNPGDADPGVTYQYAHIDVIVYNSTVYNGTVVYDMGNLDANQVYTPGKASPRITEVTTEAEFVGFASAMSPAGEPAMITSQRLAYEFLRDNCGRPGTVDPSLPKDPPAPAAPTPAATSTPTATSTSTDPAASSSTSASTSGGTSSNTGSASSSSSTGGT